ncbi:MAG TPA: hypothetical protein VN248_05710 [Arenimonas sp.]|nr:hypothetical protein [Arenimonas sp.]
MLIGGAATVLLGLFALSFLIKEDLPAAKPMPVVEDVHMPPPPPAATPEQIAASEAAAKQASEAEKSTAALAEMKQADKVVEKPSVKKPAAVKAKLPAAGIKPQAETVAKNQAAISTADQNAADTRLASKRSNEKKPLERMPEEAVPVTADAAKPKEARFNMTQGGKKMTPEDFDAWMKAQGIRIVPAKPAAAPVTPAVEPVNPEAGKEG